MNSDAWKKHFVDMASGKFRDRSFYQLGSQRGGSDTNPPIQLISPTQQAVEMAHSQENLRRQKRSPANKKAKKAKTASKIKKPARKKPRQSTTKKTKKKRLY